MKTSTKTYRQILPFLHEEAVEAFKRFCDVQAVDPDGSHPITEHTFREWAAAMEVASCSVSSKQVHDICDDIEYAYAQAAAA